MAIYRPPEGPAALRLMLIVDSLFRYTTPPPNLRVVRGLYLYGPDTNDFPPCGSSSTPGHVEGNMRPIAALVGDSAWRARTAPTLVFEVEAWVRERADCGRRIGSRTYERPWAMDSVLSVSSRRIDAAGAGRRGADPAASPSAGCNACRAIC